MGRKSLRGKSNEIIEQGEKWTFSKDVKTLRKTVATVERTNWDYIRIRMAKCFVSSAFIKLSNLIRRCTRRSYEI